MNTRAINAAAGVVQAAVAQGRVPAGIACALDAAGLLMSPEIAAELEHLRARVAELEQDGPREHTVDEDPIAFALTDQATAPLHLDGRLNALLTVIRAQGGEWTTRRVQTLYRAQGLNAPLRTTARKDLNALFAMGQLVEHDMKGRRHFTLARGGAR